MHLVGFTIGQKRQYVYCAVRHSYSFRLFNLLAPELFF